MGCGCRTCPPRPGRSRATPTGTTTRPACTPRSSATPANKSNRPTGGLLDTVETTGRERDHAWRELSDTRHALTSQLGRYGRLAHTENPDERIEKLDHDIDHDRDRLTTAQARIGQLAAEPAIRSQPPGFLTTEHDIWKSDRDSEHEAVQLAATVRAAAESEAATRERMSYAAQQAYYQAPEPDHGPSIGR